MPKFYYIKVGFKGIFSLQVHARTCIPGVMLLDVYILSLFNLIKLFICEYDTFQKLNRKLVKLY